MGRSKKLIRIRIRALSKNKPKYYKRGYRRKIAPVSGVTCSKCGKLIPRGRKTIAVKKGVTFGIQTWYYHPSCYKKVYKIKKKKKRGLFG